MSKVESRNDFTYVCALGIAVEIFYLQRQRKIKIETKSPAFRQRPKNLTTDSLTLRLILDKSKISRKLIFIVTNFIKFSLPLHHLLCGKGPELLC